MTETPWDSEIEYGALVHAETSWVHNSDCLVSEDGDFWIVVHYGTGLRWGTDE